VGQSLGMLMIDGQSFDVVVHRIKCGRRQKTRLTHASTEQFASPSSLGDEFFGPGQAGSDWGA
jgi:hypothetical protein